MFETYRLFNCARCREQVCICQGCDRGNIYCPPCAPVARKESRQGYSNAYQKTDAGRANHAARQQAYLDRKERDQVALKRCSTCTESAKMTQHGSAVADEASSLGAQPEVLSTSVLTKEIDDVRYPLLPLPNPAYKPDSATESAAGAIVVGRTLRAATEAAQAVPGESGIVVCSFCGQRCGPYTRLDFLRTPHRRPPGRPSAYF